jgi:hypothetical protein
VTDFLRASQQGQATPWTADLLGALALVLFVCGATAYASLRLARRKLESLEA